MTTNINDNCSVSSSKDQSIWIIMNYSEFTETEHMEGFSDREKENFLCMHCNEKIIEMISVSDTEDKRASTFWDIAEEIENAADGT